MTETSPASFMTGISDTLEQRLETVGRPFPHVSAKVVDAQNRILPRGSRGELCVSGYLLQQGYFRNPEKTAEVMIRDQNDVLWMHTGDEATIDEHGYCRITGRIKDIIIRGRQIPSHYKRMSMLIYGFFCKFRRRKHLSSRNRRTNAPSSCYP